MSVPVRDRRGRPAHRPAGPRAGAAGAVDVPGRRGARGRGEGGRVTTTEARAPSPLRPRADELIDGYEVVVGLEVHVELATATKLFSGSPNRFGDEPNTNIDPVTLGLPGSLPVLNRRAVELAIRIGVALHCDGPALPLPPEELLLPGHAEGLPDLPVRPAAQRRRLARAALGASASASSGPTWRRTPASPPTSAARAVGSTAATTRWSTTTAPACPWSRSWAGPTSARPTRPAST